MNSDDTPLADRDIRLVGGVCIAAGAMFAYFAQPLLRFADPFDLALGGGIMACLLIAIWSHLVNESSLRRQKIYSWLGTAVFCAFMVIVIAPALVRSRAHDRRCREIEETMLSGVTGRDDLPDIFEALQCRPQLDVGPPRGAR